LTLVQQPRPKCFGESFGGVGAQLIQRREHLTAQVISGFAVRAEDEFDEMGVGVDRVGVASDQLQVAGLQDPVVRRLRQRPRAGRADHRPAIPEFSQ
jgi:hypothetical protein